MWLPSERVRPCPSPSTASWRVRSWPLTRFPNSPLISVVSVGALVYRTYSTCEQIIPYAKRDGNTVTGRIPAVWPARPATRPAHARPAVGRYLSSSVRSAVRPPAPRASAIECVPARSVLALADIGLMFDGLRRWHLRLSSVVATVRRSKYRLRCTSLERQARRGIAIGNPTRLRVLPWTSPVPRPRVSSANHPAEPSSKAKEAARCHRVTTAHAPERLASHRPAAALPPPTPLPRVY